MEEKLKTQRGATMLEVIGVLGVLGVLAASVWRLVDSAMAKYRISNGVSQIQSLQRNISRFYAATGNYNDLKKSTAVETLIKENVVPKSMKASSTTLRHAFGGSVTLANVDYENEPSASSTSYSITFNGLSSKVCMEMIQLKWPETDSANLKSISVGDDKYTWPAYSDSTDKYLPVTITDAMKSCYQGSKSTTVNITWEFK